jgi:hypothetical protein
MRRRREGEQQQRRDDRAAPFEQIIEWDDGEQPDGETQLGDGGQGAHHGGGNAEAIGDGGQQRLVEMAVGGNKAPGDREQADSCVHRDIFCRRVDQVGHRGWFRIIDRA